MLTAAAASMLTAAYEQLRHDATGPSEQGASPRGLAIFLRQGMVAWMHACISVVSTPAANPPDRAGVALTLCPSVQHEVVDVLAAMALTTALEVTP